MTAPFNRPTAYHEAGHAVAKLRLTRDFHSAHVLPKGQRTMVDRRGREISDIAGLVQGGSFNWHTLGIPRSKVEAEGISLKESAHRHMVVDLAGPFAEARWRRANAFEILVRYGIGDWESANAIAKWLWPDDERRRDDALGRAEYEAKALARNFWGAITCVAEILVSKGELLFEDVPFSLRPSRGHDAAPA